MSLERLLGYDPKYEGFDSKYPSPPRIHWLVLLAAWIAIDWAIARVCASRYVGLLDSLVMDARGFYLWIKTLDPESKSPFWCDVYVVIELACAGLGTMQNPSAGISLAIDLLGIASAILGIATLFLIRADLEHHFNDREHAGLVLNGWMTFFFSFLYFQFHLYDIAKRKKLQAQTMGAASGAQIS